MTKYFLSIFGAIALTIGLCVALLHHDIIPVDVMYHGSPNRDIMIFQPKMVQDLRYERDRNVIFASPSIAFASCYLFRWDDSWVHQMVSFGNPDVIYMVISDRERFNKLDAGGAIYLVPPQNFDHHKGLSIYEWTNKNPVPILSKIEFNSALEAMKKFGIKVYFVNKEQFKEYISLSGDAQEKFLSEVQND